MAIAMVVERHAPRRGKWFRVRCVGCQRMTMHLCRFCPEPAPLCAGCHDPHMSAYHGNGDGPT